MLNFAPVPRALLLFVVGFVLCACERGPRPPAAVVAGESAPVAQEAVAAAAPAAERYRVWPKFRKGDQVVYDVALTPRGQKAAVNGLGMTMAVSVLEVDESSVVLEFKPAIPEKLRRSLPKTVTINFDLAPQVRFDLGTFQYELANVEECQRWAREFAAIQKADMERRKMDPELIARFARVFEGIASDDQLLMAAVLKTPMVLMGTFGQSGEVGVAEAAEVDAPNPMKAGTIRAIRSVKVTREPKSPGSLTFEIEVKPDIGQLAGGMVDAVDRVGGRPFEEGFKQELQEQASCVIEQIFVVDEESGWPERVVARTVVTFGEERDVEETKLERRPAEGLQGSR